MPARPLHDPARVADWIERGWWTDETMDAVLRARIAVDPDREALVDPANKQALVGMDPTRLTWREMDEEVDRLAGIFLDHGLEPGDVLGVQLPNTVELVTTILAAWRIGLIVSPLPMQYRGHEFRTLGRRAGTTAFVSIARFGDRSPAAEALTGAADVPSIRTVMGFGPDLPDGVVDIGVGGHADAARILAHQDAHPADPNDCLTICWTSGTTSIPKGVPRCHLDWIAISRVTISGPDLTADDVLLNPFPMVNMAGINGMFLPWLRVGGVLVQHHPFDLPTFLAQIQQERATYTVAPPALLSMLLARPEILQQVDISSLRLIGSGSAPLPPSMVRAWDEDHGIGIINFFGSNEGIALLTTPTDVPDPEQRARFFPNHAADRPWSNPLADATGMRLVDLETGEVITEPGVPGELHLGGPTVFAGYLPGDDVSSPFDEQGWLATGDVFRIAGEDGEFLEFVDRVKDIIIRGGMNIASAELEGLIASHPAVAEVAVVGIPHDVLGEQVCAVVVPAGDATVELDDIVAHLRAADIASYKLPERLVARDVLPRNPVGKVLKHELVADLRAPA